MAILSIGQLLVGGIGRTCSRLSRGRVFFSLIRICIDADETRANNGVNYPNYCLEKQRAFDSTGFKAYKELMVCKLPLFISSHRLTR